MKMSMKKGIALWLVVAILLCAASLSGLFSLTIALALSIILLFIFLPRDFVKNWRVLLWLFFILISVLLIAPNPSANGVVITSIDKSIQHDLSTGDILYFVNGIQATQDSVLQNYSGIIPVITNHGSKYINANGSLGVVIDNVPKSNIKFGLDIKGGVHALVEPNISTVDTLEQVKSTLQSRINIYGLRESVFRTVQYQNKGYIDISIAGGTTDELKNLIESQGKFEAKIPFTVPVSNNKATLTLGSVHTIGISNSSITVDNTNVDVGGSFSLDNINFIYNGYDGNKINLTSTVFTGNDIITVYYDPQRSRIESAGSGYQWTFGIQLSSAGAQKFAYVTNNINPLATGYLESQIAFYLDGKFIDSLNIASTLRGKPETEIAISGGAQTMQDATKVMTQLQSILRSGSLPTSVKIIQLDQVSPTLGEGFVNNAVAAGIAAILGVLVIISIRYRKPKLVLPMMAISLSEVLIVVGVASGLFGWTIDLPAIAGIIASVGTGIDSQIIILDRAIRKEDQHLMTLTQKLKSAFFVVFGSAGTVIAAMLPLLFSTFGIFRGFAIVTITGVLVGVFIARPVYAVIVERLLKDHAQ